MRSKRVALHKEQLLCINKVIRSQRKSRDQRLGLLVLRGNLSGSPVKLSVFCAKRDRNVFRLFGAGLLNNW